MSNNSSKKLNLCVPFEGFAKFLSYPIFSWLWGYAADVSVTFWVGT